MGLCIQHVLNKLFNFFLLNKFIAEFNSLTSLMGDVGCKRIIEFTFTLFFFSYHFTPCKTVSTIDAESLERFFGLLYSLI